MNDKEIEAIRLLNLCINSNAPLPEEALSWVKIVLNLTGKLQKENEELKERNKGLTTALEEWVNGERINDIKHISKDKIANKIKDIDLIDEYYGPNGWESEREYAKDILKELLEGGII